MGQELARALGVRAIFTERAKDTDEMQLRRGFSVEKGEKVFAVEDVITTGKSVKESIAVMRAACSAAFDSRSERYTCTSTCCGSSVPNRDAASGS